MVLSPQDIHNKEFSVKMRGYSIDEVNDFLDQVLKDYQITIDQNHKLNASLKNAEKKLANYNSMEKSLNQSILVAQEAANNVQKQSEIKSRDIINNANKKSKTIVKNANQQANDKIKDASNRAKSLATVIEDLQKDALLFRNKFQTILKAQLDFVKNDEWNHLLNSNDIIDYKGIHDSIKKLDKSNPYSVKSKSKLGNKINEDLQTLVFYPDDSYKTIR
ncbi:cell division protein DivIVA [Philodulcilactobacillus myokoensis]|uniref:Cell division protein DivIVA n=1 Tax=Philodulcilactobacillus myokoensis TaxID=2929573 RepID=A0A9W6ESG5_9LACO|nr:DivIVA domain-containing protein [Philodulcilactobacillus myokoensis]GLB47016.1 cell division protein DivIVA [Philodulcilactobacillus myokoensis]